MLRAEKFPPERRREPIGQCGLLQHRRDVRTDLFPIGGAKAAEYGLEVEQLRWPWPKKMIHLLGMSQFPSRVGQQKPGRLVLFNSVVGGNVVKVRATIGGVMVAGEVIGDDRLGPQESRNHSAAFRVGLGRIRQRQAASLNRNGVKQKNPSPQGNSCATGAPPRLHRCGR